MSLPCRTGKGLRHFGTAGQPPTPEIFAEGGTNRENAESPGRVWRSAPYKFACKLLDPFSLWRIKLVRLAIGNQVWNDFAYEKRRFSMLHQSVIAAAVAVATVASAASIRSGGIVYITG